MTTMILVVFPMDFLEHGIYGSNFSMLGLGDIVLPGNHFVNLTTMSQLSNYP